MAELLNTQKADLFRLTQARGLSPTEFIFGSLPGELLGAVDAYVPALIHATSQFYCAFVYDQRGWSVSFTPGQDARNETRARLNWEGVLHYCGLWLLYLSQEIATPDPWATISDSPATWASGAENDRFSVSEQRKLASVINGLKAEIHASNQYTALQLAAIDAKIDDVISASERLGRKDWALYALGTFTTIAMTVALGPDQSRHLFAIVIHALNALMTALPLLSP